MAITKQTMDTAFELVKDQIKNFFQNLLNPNMKIEDIADVVSSRLDPVIIANDKKGLHYSAGKFYIKSPDEKHFQLEFEMFFKDDEDKWHKLANSSELRDIKLLDEDAAKTIQKLKFIEFPINAPKFENEEKVEEKIEKKVAEVKNEEKVTDDIVTIDVEAEIKKEK